MLVGSRHTARSLWAALDDPQLPERTRLGPPGRRRARASAPREPREAAARAARARSRACAPPPPAGPDGRSRRAPSPATSAPPRGARAPASSPARERLVAFVGKLIVNKGVDLLLAAWPLVLERVPRATLVVVGFGAYRAALERLLAALAAGGWSGREIALRAERAREASGRDRAAAPPARVSARPGRRARASATCAAARGAARARVLTGRLDHGELAELLPACEALVVPEHVPRGVRHGRRRGRRLRCAADQRRALRSRGGQRARSRAPIPPRGRRVAVLRGGRSRRAGARRAPRRLAAADPELRAQTRAGLVADGARALVLGGRRARRHRRRAAANSRAVARAQRDCRRAPFG